MILHAFESLADAPEEEFPEAVCQPQPQQVFPDVTPPGMAYVPYQQWSDTVYDARTGFQRGTLFPVLDLPFSQAGGECS